MELYHDPHQLRAFTGRSSAALEPVEGCGETARTLVPSNLDSVLLHQIEQMFLSRSP
jgi:hypothetical protein